MFISYFCFYRLRKEFVERIELDSSLRSFDYNPSEVYALFYDIQKAVKNENATGLASLITYPIRVFIKDKYVILELPEEFVKSYHEIVNKNVRRTILNAKADDIWVNWQGIRMFENGILIVGDKIAAFCFNYDYNTDRHDVEYYNNRGREIIRPLSTNDEYKILTEIERKGWKADCNWLDYTVYYADINNDTTNDYVITWMSGGSGGFTQIDSVWDKVSESEYVRLPIEKVFAESFNFDEEDFDYLETTLRKDTTKDALSAAELIYNKVRPGELIDPISALDYIKNQFLNTERIFIGRIARRKINAKLSLNKPLD